ncbi:MAG: metal ABC transporter permease [Candidatus Electryonea clarkiae]|nr:metal ABC transporter permease [Candidatus Electryonea clarkiae]MDP8285668.1 metal ABC transporter permease [Candidatus Electryonea clarkiae]
MDYLGIFSDYTLRTVALGAALLGLVSGALGTFAFLRRQSLIGDAMSHAALPGIALAFLITGSKATIVLLIGAAIAGWLGTWFIIKVVNLTRIKEDSALGLILSVFFGFGLVLLTFIQKMPQASQAGLDKFLFGQAATLLERDVVVMAALGVPVLILTILFWKELKLLSFDRDFGSHSGFPMHRLELLLTSLLVIAIVIGLQTVGVVLMSAMIVAPPAAARQWTDRMGVMVVLSSFFGAVSGVAGAVISSLSNNLPTGPTIVICMSGIVIFSILFAPNRGLLWAAVQKKRNNRKLQLQAVMEDLYFLSRQHKNPLYAHPVAVLRTMSAGHGGVDRSLEVLKSRGLAQSSDDDNWSLTETGIKEAGANVMKFKGQI